jgi:hypothetical protein
MGKLHHSKVFHPEVLLNERKKDQSAFADFNDKVAVYISNHVGTMYCAYLFAVIGVTGVVAALTANAFLVLVIGAVSGYFLQLVLLPIIMVAQNVAQKASDAKADADHMTLTYLATIQDEQLEILKDLKGKKK